MNREEVLDQLYAAHTLREIEAARRLRSAYLAQHPEDDEVRDLGEMFGMMEEAIKLLERDSAGLSRPDREAAGLTKPPAS